MDPKGNPLTSGRDPADLLSSIPMPNESNLFSTHFHLGILAILLRIQEFYFYFLNDSKKFKEKI